MASSKFSVQLVDLECVRPTEKYNKQHCNELIQKISQLAMWTHPIWIDDHEHALMDGHHRYHAAKYLGFKIIPAIFLSYRSPLVKLSSWNPDLSFEPHDIWSAARSGKLFAPKSTRHIVSVKLPHCYYPIENLFDLSFHGELIDVHPQVIVANS